MSRLTLLLLIFVFTQSSLAIGSEDKFNIEESKPSLSYRIVNRFFDLDAFLKGRNISPVQFENCQSTYKGKIYSANNSGIWSCLIDIIVKKQFMFGSAQQITTRSDIYFKNPKITIGSTIRVDVIRAIQHLTSLRDAFLKMDISIELDEPIDFKIAALNQGNSQLNFINPTPKIFQKIVMYVEFEDDPESRHPLKVLIFNLYSTIEDVEPFHTFQLSTKLRAFSDDDFYFQPNGETFELFL